MRPVPCAMNRVTRVVTSLRKPALHWLTSYYLTPWSAIETSATWTGRYGKTIGIVAVIAGAMTLVLSILKWSRVLWIWIFAEGLFLIVNAFRYGYLNRPTSPPETNADVIRSHFHKFLNSILCLDYVEHLGDWFLDAAFERLSRENIVDLIAYAFAYRSRDLRDDDVYPFEQLWDELLRHFQLRTGYYFREGRTDGVRFRAHLWDNLRAVHYPLTLYLLLELLDVAFACLMAMSEFLCLSFGQQRYYLRCPAGVIQNRPAILFLHGLGLGAIFYYPFILALCRLGYPLLVLEMRHLSMRLCFQVPSVDEVVCDVDGILKRHCLERVIVIGHSYGTFVASRFHSLHPERVKGMCLLDPVCCVMHNPKLLSTFVYGKLRWDSAKACVHSSLLTIFSHDPAVAASVSRRFKWTELNLWPGDLPAKCILFLSRADALVPIEDVQTLFGNTHAKVIVHPTHAHGSFLADLDWQMVILRHIRELFKESPLSTERQGSHVPSNDSHNAYKNEINDLHLSHVQN